MRTGFFFLPLFFLGVLIDCKANTELAEGAIEAAVTDLIIAPLFREVKEGRREKLRLQSIIIENEDVRGRLREYFKPFSDFVLCVGREEVRYGSVHNQHRPSGREAYVSEFRVLNESNGIFEVEWTRSFSPVAGFTKRFRMMLINGRWSLIDVETVSVS